MYFNDDNAGVRMLNECQCYQSDWYFARLEIVCRYSDDLCNGIHSITHHTTDKGSRKAWYSKRYIIL